MAGAPRRARGLPPARPCACRRFPTWRLRRAEARAVQGRPRLSCVHHALRGRRSPGAQQAVRDRGAGRHQDRAPYRPPARRHGRRTGDAAAARAPARPRYVRRAGDRQAARGGGEARPRLPDPLGAQDLLGAGAWRAEAAARQDRGGAGQGRGAGGRPRAQGAPRRAGPGAIGGDPLRRGGPGRAEGRRSCRSSPSPGGSTSSAPIWPLSAIPSSATRNITATATCPRASPNKLHLHARRISFPHPSGEGVVDVTAPLPEHMRRELCPVRFRRAVMQPTARMARYDARQAVYGG